MLSSSSPYSNMSATTPGFNLVGICAPIPQNQRAASNVKYRAGDYFDLYSQLQSAPTSNTFLSPDTIHNQKRLGVNRVCANDRTANRKGMGGFTVPIVFDLSQTSYMVCTKGTRMSNHEPYNPFDYYGDRPVDSEDRWPTVWTNFMANCHTQHDLRFAFLGYNLSPGVSAGSHAGSSITTGLQRNIPVQYYNVVVNTPDFSLDDKKEVEDRVFIDFPTPDEHRMSIMGRSPPGASSKRMHAFGRASASMGHLSGPAHFVLVTELAWCSRHGRNRSAIPGSIREQISAGVVNAVERNADMQSLHLRLTP